MLALVFGAGDRLPFAAILRHMRELAGLTQAELAALLGVAAGTVARWEQGQSAPPPRAGLPLCQEEVLRTIAERAPKRRRRPQRGRGFYNPDSPPIAR